MTLFYFSGRNYDILALIIAQMLTSRPTVLDSPGQRGTLRHTPSPFSWSARDSSPHPQSILLVSVGLLATPPVHSPGQRGTPRHTPSPFSWSAWDSSPHPQSILLVSVGLLATPPVHSPGQRGTPRHTPSPFSWSARDSSPHPQSNTNTTRWP